MWTFGQTPDRPPPELCHRVPRCLPDLWSCYLRCNIKYIYVELRFTSDQLWVKGGLDNLLT